MSFNKNKIIKIKYYGGLHSVPVVRHVYSNYPHKEAGRIMDWLSAFPFLLGNLILRLTIKQKKSLIHYPHSI